MLLFGRDSQFEKKKEALLKRNGAKYLVTYSGWTEGLYQGPVKEQLNKDYFELNHPVHKQRFKTQILINQFEVTWDLY